MKKHITSFLFIFLLITGISFDVQSQIAKSGIPLSIEQNAPDVLITEDYTPSVDWNQIAQQDAISRNYGLAPRGGLSVPVGRRITEFGEWRLMPNGDVMWRVKLHSNNATALGVVFSDFYLPPNTELYVYDESKSMIAGAFTSDNNHYSMQFSTRLLSASTIIVEYIERGAGVNIVSENLKPYATINSVGGSVLTNYQPQTNFRIDELIHMYADVYSFFDKPNTGASAACQINVRCSPVGDNWQNQRRGVAHMVFREGGNWFFCTGSLLNNTLQNATPYFLTAHHCGGTATAADRNVWQFYFNYERPTCANTGTPNTSHMMTGCVYRAGAPLSGGNDFMLVELNNNVPASYNPFFNGWDRAATGATSGVSIHHPAGDVKKISTFSNPLISATPNISGQTMAANAAWRVIWSSNANGHGVTESGSSGAPIFNQHGRVVGHLSGGSSNCANPTSPDFNGKFNYSWESHGTNANQRLRPWLDPAGTNPTFLAGYDPNNPSVSIEAEMLNILVPVASYTSAQTITPQVTIRNNGSNALTSATVSYTLNGGAAVNVNWSGNLATGQSTNVSFGPINIVVGNHTFVATVTAAGDQVPANNSLTRNFSVTNCAPQQLPYSEIFNQSVLPACWSVQNGHATNRWESTTGYTISGSTTVNPQSGSHFWYVPWIAQAQNEWLITPSFNFTGVTNAQIRFWFNGSFHWSVTNNNCDLSLMVRVGGGSWTSIWNETNHTGFNDTTTYVWLESVVGLAAYQGQSNVQFAFRYTGNDGANFAIDNISISGLIVSDEEIHATDAKVSIYPNPARDVITVSMEDENDSFELITITDFAGKLVHSQSAKGLKSVTVDTSKLTNGLYFVTVTTESGRFVKKLILQ